MRASFSLGQRQNALTQRKGIVFTLCLKFEYDEAKSRSNLEKHGIDFIEAQLLWNDPDILEVPAQVRGEPRYLVIGRIDGRCWSGVITYRQENVRIISVRRSRTEEVALYENSGI